MRSEQIVTINSRKFDQTVRRSWTATLIDRTPPLLVFEGIFEIDVDHDGLGHIPAGTVSREFYWLDRWYSIFRFHKPDGTLRNYYCNVNMPPIFSGMALDYVDLDIDVVVWPDASYQVLDIAEFEANADLYLYPDAVLKNADTALAQLVDLIENDGLPK